MLILVDEVKQTVLFSAVQQGVNNLCGCFLNVKYDIVMNLGLCALCGLAGLLRCPMLVGSGCM